MRYLLLCFLIFSFITVEAQRQQNTSGNWNNAGNWVGGNIGDDLSETVTLDGVNSTIVNLDDYTIGGLTIQNGTVFNINTGGKLTIGSSTQVGFITNTNGTVTMNVNGDLDLFGDMNVKNNFTLNVNGTMRIRGDFEANNSASFNVNGTLIIEGDLIGKNGFSFNVPGSVDVGGDLDVKNGASVVVPFGSFTIGGSCNAGNVDICTIILPITLLSFEAEQKGPVVEVRWVSGTELNNDYYTVQVSKDGREFQEVEITSGAGTSDSPISYSITDDRPFNGIAYYRLVQTDYDGSREVFDPVRVDFSPIDASVVFPNPISSGETLKIYTGASNGDGVKVSLRDMQGRIINDAIIESAVFETQVSGNLTPGVYIVEIRNAISRSLHRLVVK